MNIYEQSLEQLVNFFSEHGMNPAKAKIVFRSVYREDIHDFDNIAVLGKKAKTVLKENFTFDTITVAEQLESSDTCKYAFELSDKNIIETVIMKHNYGNGLCVSTQLGCAMNCAFCESGRNGKLRNLSAGEMVAQFVEARRLCGEVSHVVLMGIGEPFDNYDNVMKFIGIINSPFGADIGIRHITVSTSGLVPMIERFSDEPIAVNLAISLHAPTDEIRSQLMPVNKKYPIDVLMRTVRNYSVKTRNKVTLEYIMLGGINDSPECAEALAALADGLDCFINLIPYNETSASPFLRTGHDKLMVFYDILKKKRLNVTIRREFGTEMKAACGQLMRHDNTM